MIQLRIKHRCIFASERSNHLAMKLITVQFTHNNENCVYLETLLVYLSRYLDQETVKGPFQSSSQAVTCHYLFNHSKVKASCKKGKLGKFQI